MWETCPVRSSAGCLSRSRNCYNSIHNRIISPVLDRTLKAIVKWHVLDPILRITASCLAEGEGPYWVLNNDFSASSQSVRLWLYICRLANPWERRNKKKNENRTTHTNHESDGYWDGGARMSLKTEKALPSLSFLSFSSLPFSFLDGLSSLLLSLSLSLD